MTHALTPSLNLPNTPVLITGGASGIGYACAQALAAVGRPVAIWDINGDRAAEAAKNIHADFGVATHAEAIDLRELAGYSDSIDKTRKALGPIGGLVHAAGIVDQASVDGITEESWAAGIDTHLRPLAILVRDLLPDFSAQPHSAVVAITSINATLGNAVNPIYSAAKGGMLSLVRSMADRLAHDGIRINSVSPGQILTPMMQPAVDHLPDGYFEKRILLERLGAPEEIGRVVRFLLSTEASYLTAAEIVVDGGNISSQRG
ncbi:SDR family NAD(P)-dependent oxidoreductase [Sphingopyxis yananensis]|uniref:SDR family NAD(P)-dependent oxidoreductase n=1 Tax=Sphingopyxis yananensis TaxID=2886687 RepID=UPI001D0F9FD7|nr:SDR family oxidoreductase [Sphingopyxis yananensis]MCC2601059.1 SDR family oxidoreductase [Sphingopyxis yananensis]